MCTFVALLTSGPGKHSVSKSRVWHPFIAEHSIIGRKLSCKRRVDAGPHPALRRPLYSPFRLLRGDHPPVARVVKSIGTVLRVRTWPFRLVSILDIVTCDCNT